MIDATLSRIYRIKRECVIERECVVERDPLVVATAKWAEAQGVQRVLLYVILSSRTAHIDLFFRKMGMTTLGK